MPYNEDLAARVRAALAHRKNITEKKMFGGVGWLLNGNMCVGVWKESLIARLGEDCSLALREPHVREFDITGKSLTGWVMIGLPALTTDAVLREWVNRCFAFVRTLPAKA